MNANVYQFMKLVFRKGNPAAEGHRAFSATTRRRGGFVGPGEIPDLPRDDDIVTEADLRSYVAALERNGFYGPTAWYMNHQVNAEYAGQALNDGYLELPVLFLNAQYDYICECTHSRLAEPMRTYCRRLTEETIRAGHWLAQEKPLEVSAALVKWLATAVADIWPRPR
jgi:pimeloyl-ACP methyl ester carboxylesterase